MILAEWVRVDAVVVEVVVGAVVEDLADGLRMVMYQQSASDPAPAEESPTAPPSDSSQPHEQNDDPMTPSTSPPGTPPSGVVVLRVIDGDTIEVRGDGKVVPDGSVARVRLLQIDTPEQRACFADDATGRTTALLPPGSRARAERDAELTDRYDRYLLYVWNDQGVFVNESLVRSGHAKAVLYPPNDKYWARISGAEDTARQAGAGLWGACPDAPGTPSGLPDTPASDTPARPNLPDGPPAGVTDVDCADLPGSVWVGPDDPHRLDADGDGIGCDAS